MKTPSFPAALMGMRVVVSPLLGDVTRMRTSPGFAELMPAGFVAELDAWMLEFFGTQQLAVQIDRNTIAVSAKTFRAMKEQL